VRSPWVVRHVLAIAVSSVIADMLYATTMTVVDHPGVLLG